ncbi:hypothetical protein Pmar_PMAR018583 [Perkinsus marinus ATCC 50983]|uniref:Uncharacterized protein n=1 Tax=Perkinsus marinus (strain ATCC 50983 / TXsc) TaxID=423536 RepID=C5L080_PERM5|nr:hypothetical protein Pmar_PMAR018583 [Perkinsus marinus ATCC 50983]EER09938.1 hypothetical protein Pmar_PMAR018583 [Perkinsus marinus ATCC 50983]|eukprot:XP_002778143.1 hypothetical protein Pmar_PMAR018583 [Perkinsus marinus ATCC 50983]
MSERLPEASAFGTESRCLGPDGSTSPADLVPQLTTISARPQESASQLYPISDTVNAVGMMNGDGSYGQQEKSPPNLLEGIGNDGDKAAGSAPGRGDGDNPVFMSMMGAAMAAAQLQNMNQQIQMQQYMLLQQQQALIAHAQMKRGSTATTGPVPSSSGSPLGEAEPRMSSPTAQPAGGMSGQLTAALISAGAHSPGSSEHSVDVKTLDLGCGITTPKADKSPGSSCIDSSDHMAESDAGTLPLVAINEDCCTLDGDNDDLKYGELTLDMGPEQGPSVGGASEQMGTAMAGYDTQTWQQFQQLQYNQWSYAAAMSNPWYSQGYPGTRGYGQGGEMMMRGDTERSGSAAAAEAVAGIKRRKKPYAAPKGVWRNNGGYNATIYVNKKRIYGPVRRNLADAVSDRRVMEDSVDSARTKVERMIEEQHKVFESDQARESFIAEESHTMIREVVAKLRAERGTHNSSNSGPSDPRPSVQSSLAAAQQSRRPGVVPSLAQAVYGTAAAARPGSMMPFMMPYPSAVWPRPMGGKNSSSTPLARTRKRDRSESEDAKDAATVKGDTVPVRTGLAQSVLFGGEGSLNTTAVEIPANLAGANERVTTDPKRARTITPTTATTSSSTSASSSSYVPLSPLFNPGSPLLSSRMFSSALPKYLRSPAFPATQLTPFRGAAPPGGPNGVDGPIIDDDIQLEESAVGSLGSLYPKGAQTSSGFPLSPTFLPYHTPSTGAAFTGIGNTSTCSASSATTAVTPTAAAGSNTSTPASTFPSLTFTSPGLQPASSQGATAAAAAAAAASFWTPHLQYLKHSPAFASQSSAAAES